MKEKMLAEIERCCTCDEPTGRAGRMDDSLYCTTCGKGPFCQSCFDIHAPLCARVATLEAQAARDAKVREAARDYQAARDAYRKVAVTDIAGWPKACVEVVYRYERLRRTIDDALAEEVE